ncbi:MAG: hypothetical protein SAMD01599839_05730 [Rectinema sp.]
MLARFDVHTRQIREGPKVIKGYFSENFTEVFARYLPTQPLHATNSNNAILDKEIKCSGSVAVADAKRYIPTEAVKRRLKQKREGKYSAFNRALFPCRLAGGSATGGTTGRIGHFLKM